MNAVNTTTFDSSADEAIARYLEARQTHLFHSIWNNAKVQELTYDDNWANGTGYFDGLACAELPPVKGLGNVYKSVDPKGRKILVINASRTRIVAFQRYSNDRDLIVYHTAVRGRDDLYHGNSNSNNREVSGEATEAYRLMHNAARYWLA